MATLSLSGEDWESKFEFRVVLYLNKENVTRNKRDIRAWNCFLIILNKRCQNWIAVALLFEISKIERKEFDRLFWNEIESSGWKRIDREGFDCLFHWNQSRDTSLCLCKEKDDFPREETAIVVWNSKTEAFWKEFMTVTRSLCYISSWHSRP